MPWPEGRFSFAEAPVILRKGVGMAVYMDLPEMEKKRPGSQEFRLFKD